MPSTGAAITSLHFANFRKRKFSHSFSPGPWAGYGLSFSMSTLSTLSTFTLFAQKRGFSATGIPTGIPPWDRESPDSKGAQVGATT